MCQSLHSQSEVLPCLDTSHIEQVTLRQSIPLSGSRLILRCSLSESRRTTLIDDIDPIGRHVEKLHHIALGLLAYRYHPVGTTGSMAVFEPIQQPVHRLIIVRIANEDQVVDRYHRGDTLAVYAEWQFVAQTVEEIDALFLQSRHHAEVAPERSSHTSPFGK